MAWGSYPVYVSVYASAAVLGSPESPPHVANVALSSKAIEAGCEIVLNTGGKLGDPYYVHVKLAVIKVPAPITDTLCTLTLSGTTQVTELPPPDYACGTWSTTFTSVRGPDFFPDAIDPIATWTETLVNVTPDGTTTVVRDDLRYHYDKRIPATVAYVEHLNDTSFESHEALYYHDEHGRLIDTGIPCDGVPTTLVEVFPYDVQVFVHPQKDHVVSDPGGPFFLWYPTAAVKVAGSGLFGGALTSIWRCDLNYRVSQGAVDGLVTGSYPFRIQKALFARSRKEKILEVYPSAFKSGYLDGLSYRGGFRLNTKPPTGNMYFTNWDGTAPDFNDGIVLYGGSAPPPVPYTPDSIPF